MHLRIGSVVTLSAAIWFGTIWYGNQLVFAQEVSLEGQPLQQYGSFYFALRLDASNQWELFFPINDKGPYHGTYLCVRPKEFEQERDFKELAYDKG